MRFATFWTLLAAGVTARGIPAVDVEGRAAAAPLATGVTPFQVISPQDALSKLSAKAQATPAAVHFLADVPLAFGPNGNVVPTSKPAAAPLVDRDVSPSPVERNADVVERATCSSPTVVYEWRALTDQHKQQFTAAIKCLMTKPARSGLAGTQTRWDDFSAIHQRMTPQIHDDGQFMPWHRYFLWMFEQEIRNTCGYQGPLAWWDETKDAGHFSSAPMFNNQYWGNAPDGNAVCISSGVFANLQLHIGPGSGNSNHCLARGVNEGTSSQITQGYLNTCWSYNSFDQMQSCIFYGVHGLGHNAIGGGVMNDVYASPGDPAFFLHHQFVNRAWRLWTNANSARLNQIGGYTTSSCEDHPSGGCTPTSMNYQLTSFNFFPAVTVGQVMNTLGGFLCYKYDY